ncbi:MAG: DNA mismatch repair endonuclease MutL [Anaeroplasmataceae bacterium]
MNRVKLLSEHLSNLIAAGEVVERPSSVVKELVENSIDANSTKIIINLIDSGTKSINVIDDGGGMSKNDAELSFYRHATSKISNEYDLFRISSLGFRGEAIPSIAAVSKFTLQTSNGIEGTKIEYKAGKKISVVDIKLNKGTNILVEDLFYNTPARLKHLKSLNSELSSIVYLLTKFAISRPDIGFILTNNKKELLNTSNIQDMNRIIGNIYGLEAAKNLIEINNDDSLVKIQMHIVKPSVTKSNKNDITIICNNRYIKNYNLTQAVISGYGNYLFNERYPIAIIKIDIDPLLIDVNVHPSKTTVKISNENKLIEMVIELVSKALNSTNHIIETDESFINKLSTNNYTFTNDSSNRGYVKPKFDFTEYENKLENNLNEFNIFEEKNVSINEPIYTYNEEEKVLDNNLPSFTYIGQFHGTYLLFQNEEGLFLVDQHAAHERINYEKYIKMISDINNSTQPLLIALNMEFSKNEYLYVKSIIDELLKIGYLLEESGPNSFFIRQVPMWNDHNDTEFFLKKIIDSFRSSNSVDLALIKDELAQMLACKKSIKANHNYSFEEVEKLIQDLNKCKNSFTCPHGRPVVVKISTNDIHKLFKRI